MAVPSILNGHRRIDRQDIIKPPCHSREGSILPSILNGHRRIDRQDITTKSPCHSREDSILPSILNGRRMSVSSPTAPPTAISS
eukprot:4824013-Pyramimonas_sp.AAC.1